MAIHSGVETSDERLDVVASVRPRVIDLADEADVDRLIREALDELTPASVSTFLPILVERRVRDRLEHRSGAGA
jgi:hypothetical protein